MPLPGRADGHSPGHGVSQHRLQLDQIRRTEVVVRAIGWGLVDNVPAPIAHVGAEGDAPLLFGLIVMLKAP